jgi:moderate conductance mechanosensitive channel
MMVAIVSNTLRLNKLTLILIIFLCGFTCGAWAEDAKSQTTSNFSIKQETNQSAKKNEVKKIDEKTAETKQVLKEKEQVGEAAKKTAEEVIQQKEVIQKEVELTEQAAVVAKQEAEVLKKVAEVQKDPEAAKKAKVLEKEAEQLIKEAEVKKEQLSVAEQKATIALQSIEHNKITIERLQKDLQGLRTERAAHRTLLEKATSAGIIASVGLLIFIILGRSVRRFAKIISKAEMRKGAIIESETVLRLKTIGKLLNWLGGIIIFLVVIYLILDNFGMNVNPLIAGAGVMGLAFGFGGQYLIRDLINGLFIILEGQYHVNDVIKIGEIGGLVEDINLRVTILRDLEGRVIFIPNGEIKTVINFTRDYSQALFDIGVAYKENVDQVMDVIKQIAADMRQDPYFGRLILQNIEMFGVDKFSDSAVIIKFRIMTLPIKQWEVSREFKRRLKNRFDEMGIEIPFPHHTLYWGTDKPNDWMKDIGKKIR